MSFLLSGEPMPNDRRRRDQDGPMQIRNGRPKPEEPSTAELLATLIERIDKAEAAAQARHAEVLARLDALDKAVFDAADAAGCADLSVEELKGHTHWLLERLYNQVVDAIEELGDAPAT